MINSDHHVAINGVNYKLVFSGQGTTYERRREPLRPPNAVVVQGAGRQDLFQTRPDIIRWSLTDWSQGEGQIKFDPQNPGRHSILYNVDPFTRPGMLMPGREFTATLDDASATWNDAIVRLWAGGPTDKLYAVIVTQGGTPGYFTWDDTNEKWSTVTSFASITATSSSDGLDTDDTNLYYYDKANGFLWRWDGSTETKMNSAASSVSQGIVMEMGDYVYLIDPSGYETWEIAKTASSGAFSSIDSGPKGSRTLNYSGAPFITAKGPNRLYIGLSHKNGSSSIREIVPTTAAAAGYGTEIAHYPGVTISSMWYQGGIIYIAGRVDGGGDTERVLLYQVVGGDYGSLGRVRPSIIKEEIGYLIGDEQGASLVQNHLVLYDGQLTPTETTKLFILDTTEGAIAQLGELPGTAGASYTAVEWKGDIFVPYRPGSSAYRIFRGKAGEYTTETSYAESPSHDFGLSGEKLLSSITVSTEALPADWEVAVKYSTDDDAFVTAGTYSTTGGNGAKYDVSTGGSSVTFRTLRIQVTFNYTGGGTPTTAPVVSAVDVAAQINESVAVWDLLLDMSDDLSAISKSRRGYTKIDNLTALADNTAVTFLDGFTHPEAGQYDTHSVVVDSFRLILDRPGEGVAAVTLKEVF